MGEMREDRTRRKRDPRTDSELLRAAEGDPEPFGIFYDRHVRVILAFFYRRTADPETAADLTSETFAQAFISRRRYRDTAGSARVWLLGIARHELARMLRGGRVDDRARRRLGLERVDMDDSSFERVEALVDLAPLQEEIRRALESLSPKLAEAISLRVGLGLPYTDVARRLGCSEGAARIRVARGLARLAEMLGVT